MALNYRKSTKSIARKYERSPGMVPNVGGVTHMTVINPGRPPKRNPFQWIRGKTAKHLHVSPSYRTVKSAKDWAKRHESESGHARLYPVDEYGTIMSSPMSRKQLLNKNPRRNKMAYNLGALRRAMRANMSEADRVAMKAAARGVDTGGASKRSSKRGGSKKKAAKRSGSKRRSFRGPVLGARPAKRASKHIFSKRGSKRVSKKTTVKGGKIAAKATAKPAAKAAKSASKQLGVAKKASTRAKKATSKKAAAGAARISKRAASKAAKAAVKATKAAKKAKPSSKKAANKSAAKARRAASKAATAASAALQAQARVSRKLAHRGRLSRKVGSFRTSTKRHSKYKGRVKGWSASPFRTGRLFNPPYIHVTSKRPARLGKRISMTANMLGRIGQHKGRPSGQRVQLVEFGPRSKRKGYATYVPGHVSERGYVRKFHFGGAARAAHNRAQKFGYSRKRYSKKPVTANRRRTSMRRNSKKRHSVRRNSKRGSRRRSSRRVSRNPNWVIVKNRRGKRRMRRNIMIMGIDPIKQVIIPGGYAVAGLMVANAAANVAASMPSITGVLDASRPDAPVTKALAGALGAGLTLAFAGKLPSMLRSNITPIVAGMGCAVAVRLLRGTQAAPYLGRLGEYVSQPMGEYVSQPMGAYVTDPSMGEYVSQPMGGMGGLGVAYAMAGGEDRQLDIAEAAAGVGVYEAAAGMGMMYAAAGMGGEPRLPQLPFVSQATPTDMAANITASMQRNIEVPEQDFAAEDSGHRKGRGIFMHNLFDGMI